MDCDDVEEAILRVGVFLRGVKVSRRAHCERTGALAESLGRAKGFDGRKAFLAGLAHDMCRHLPENEQRALAVDRDTRNADLAAALLHGPAAASMLLRDFGVDDEEILEAVEAHTVGKAEMSEFSMIVWMADKNEPGRGADRDTLTDTSSSVSEMMRGSLERHVEWLANEGHEVHPETEALLARIRKGSGK